MEKNKKPEPPSAATKAADKSYKPLCNCKNKSECMPFSERLNHVVCHEMIKHLRQKSEEYLDEKGELIIQYD